MAAEVTGNMDPLANQTWLIAGLGNPGDKYSNTRHNVGYAIVDALAEKMGENWKRHRPDTLVAEGRLGTLPGGMPGPKVVLAKACTYMNVSGGPLAKLAKYQGISVDTLLVVHDDLDLPAHDLRLKRGGGEGGHNGLKSLSASLGTRDYARLRVGIGRPPGRMDPADYVLAAIPSKDRIDWQVTYQLAADVVEQVVIQGFATAQQELHTK